MWRKPDMWIILAGLRRCEQDQHGIRAARFAGPPDQLLPDPLPLKSLIDRQIRQIGAEREVAESPGDSHQQSVRPGRHDQVGFPQHAVDANRVGHRSTFGEGRAAQEIDELLRREFRFQGVVERHGGEIPGRGCELRPSTSIEPGPTRIREWRFAAVPEIPPSANPSDRLCLLHGQKSVLEGARFAINFRVHESGDVCVVHSLENCAEAAPREPVR